MTNKKPISKKYKPWTPLNNKARIINIDNSNGNPFKIKKSSHYENWNLINVIEKTPLNDKEIIEQKILQLKLKLVKWEITKKEKEDLELLTSKKII